ncbi:MAG: PRC-barrel domain-containing protein [Phycisphaeraceae bacterium]
MRRQTPPRAALWIAGVATALALPAGAMAADTTNGQDTGRYAPSNAQQDARQRDAATDVNRKDVGTLDRTTLRADTMVDNQRASQLISAEVRNPQNQTLGKIHEAVIDADQGQAQYAILSHGGLMGIGDKLLAVPLHKLQMSANRNYVVLDVSLQKVKDAKGFSGDSYPARADFAWAGFEKSNQRKSNAGAMNLDSNSDLNGSSEQIIYRQTQTREERVYGLQGDRMSDRVVRDPVEQPRARLRFNTLTRSYEYIPEQEQRAQARAQATAQRELYGLQGDARQPQQRDQVQLDTTNRSYEYKAQRDTTQSSAKADLHADKARSGQDHTMMKRDFAAIDWRADDAWTHKLSAIVGLDVNDSQGTDVAEINDVVIDLSSGRIQYAALSTGAWYEFGTTKLVAVPWSAIHIDPANDVARLNVTQNKLGSAPTIERNNWPNLSDREFSQQVDDYFGTAEPRTMD